MRQTLITTLALALGAAVFAPPAAALPDLALRNNLVFDASPRGPRGSMNHLGPEQAVFIEGIVKNEGNQVAFNVMVELQAGGKVIARQTINRLRGGDQSPFSIRWIPESEGEIPVRVIVDASNTVPEGDESNNSRSETVKIAYRRNTGQGGSDSAVAAAEAETSVVRPDLVVDGEIQVFPMARAGFASTITVAVRNDGDAVAENIPIEFMVEGVRYAVKWIGVIPPEGRKEIACQWTPARRGPRSVVVRIDSENTIIESDEGNNEARKNVDVKAR